MLASSSLLAPTNNHTMPSSPVLPHWTPYHLTTIPTAYLLCSSIIPYSLFLLIPPSTQPNLVVFPLSSPSPTNQPPTSTQLVLSETPCALQYHHLSLAAVTDPFSLSPYPFLKKMWVTNHTYTSHSNRLDLYNKANTTPGFVVLHSSFSGPSDMKKGTWSTLQND